MEQLSGRGQGNDALATAQLPLGGGARIVAIYVSFQGGRETIEYRLSWQGCEQPCSLTKASLDCAFGKAAADELVRLFHEKPEQPVGVGPPTQPVDLNDVVLPDDDASGGTMPQRATGAAAAAPGGLHAAATSPYGDARHPSVGWEQQQQVPGGPSGRGGCGENPHGMEELAKLVAAMCKRFRLGIPTSGRTAAGGHGPAPAPVPAAAGDAAGPAQPVQHNTNAAAPPQPAGEDLERGLADAQQNCRVIFQPLLVPGAAAATQQVEERPSKRPRQVQHLVSDAGAMDVQGTGSPALAVRQPAAAPEATAPQLAAATEATVAQPAAMQQSPARPGPAQQAAAAVEAPAQQQAFAAVAAPQPAPAEAGVPQGPAVAAEAVVAAAQPQHSLQERVRNNEPVCVFSPQGLAEYVQRHRGQLQAAFARDGRLQQQQQAAAALQQQQQQVPATPSPSRTQHEPSAPSAQRRRLPLSFTTTVVPRSPAAAPTQAVQAAGAQELPAGGSAAPVPAVPTAAAPTPGTAPAASDGTPLAARPATVDVGVQVSPEVLEPAVLREHDAAPFGKANIAIQTTQSLECMAQAAPAAGSGPPSGVPAPPDMQQAAPAVLCPEPHIARPEPTQQPTPTRAGTQPAVVADGKHEAAAAGAGATQQVNDTAAVEMQAEVEQPYVQMLPGGVPLHEALQLLGDAAQPIIAPRAAPSVMDLPNDTIGVYNMCDFVATIYPQLGVPMERPGREQPLYLPSSSVTSVRQLGDMQLPQVLQVMHQEALAVGVDGVYYEPDASLQQAQLEASAAVRTASPSFHTAGDMDNSEGADSGPAEPQQDAVATKNVTDVAVAGLAAHAGSTNAVVMAGEAPLTMTDSQAVFSGLVHSGMDFHTQPF